MERVPTWKSWPKTGTKIYSDLTTSFFVPKKSAKVVFIMLREKKIPNTASKIFASVCRCVQSCDSARGYDNSKHATCLQKVDTRVFRQSRSRKTEDTTYAQCRGDVCSSFCCIRMRRPSHSGHRVAREEGLSQASSTDQDDAQRDFSKTALVRTSLAS